MRLRLLALALMLCAGIPAFAIHPDARPVSRIGVLRFSTRYDAVADAQVARAIQNALGEQLAVRGYEAFDAGLTLDEAARSTDHADLFIDVIGSSDSSTPVGSIGIGTPHVWTDLGVIVSRVAAEIRVYDGVTLELLRSYSLDKRSVSVAPVAVGAGQVWAGAAVAVTVPIQRWWLTRNAARDVAVEAATKIAADFARR